MLKKVLIISLILLFFVILIITVVPKYELKYMDEINFFSKKEGVSNALVFAIIKAESGFKADAVSSKNAIGLMQIKRETASFIMDKEITDDDLKNPSLNILIGTKYLNYLFNKFSSTKQVVCSYNAGEGNVKKWLKNSEYAVNDKLIKIPIEETENYYKRVYKYTQKYQKILAKKDLNINF